MTGAMYAAISGMKTHMNKLNVIGNNVANVNTFGYKTARTTFQESLYTSVRGGSNGSNTAGGMNPSQLGYGCNIGTIDLDMGTGQYVPTGTPTDCMINGDGFFFVGPKPEMGANGVMPLTNAKDLNLTRVGNFHFDSDGYLVDGSGSVVYGFVSCASGAAANPPVNPPAKPLVPGTADPSNPLFSTQLVPIRLPMAAAGDPANPTAAPVAGTPIYPGVGADGQNIYGVNGPPTTGKTININVESINIDGKTGMISATADPGGNIVIGYIPMASVANPSGLTHIQGPYYQALAGAGDCAVASLGNVTDGVGLNNGNVPAGGAATPIFGMGTTTLLSNALEGSSTDIATEFAEMISTQRGYQANTRIITVTDSMLEELVNIKR